MQGTEGNRLENEHVNLKSYKVIPVWTDHLSAHLYLPRDPQKNGCA